MAAEEKGGHCRPWLIFTFRRPTEGGTRARVPPLSFSRPATDRRGTGRGGRKNRTRHRGDDCRIIILSSLLLAAACAHVIIWVLRRTAANRLKASLARSVCIINNNIINIVIVYWVLYGVYSVHYTLQTRRRNTSTFIPNVMNSA